MSVPQHGIPRVPFHRIPSSTFYFEWCLNNSWFVNFVLVYVSATDEIYKLVKWV